MSTPSATLTSFCSAAHRCAVVMRENAGFIEDELPNVETDSANQDAIRQICGAFVANWFDIDTELDELSELDLPDCSPTIRGRVDRIHQWLGEVLPELHSVVTTLSTAVQSDPRYRSAHILVSESATNVLRAFTAMSEARDHYLAACHQQGEH